LVTLARSYLVAFPVQNSRQLRHRQRNEMTTFLMHMLFPCLGRSAVENIPVLEAWEVKPVKPMSDSSDFIALQALLTNTCPCFVGIQFCVESF